MFTEHGHCPHCNKCQEILGSDFLELLHECTACHRMIEVHPNPAWHVGVDVGKGDFTAVTIHRGQIPQKRKGHSFEPTTKRNNPFKLIHGGKSDSRLSG